MTTNKASALMVEKVVGTAQRQREMGKDKLCMLQS